MRAGGTMPRTPTASNLANMTRSSASAADRGALTTAVRSASRAPRSMASISRLGTAKGVLSSTIGWTSRRRARTSGAGEASRGTAWPVVTQPADQSSRSSTSTRRRAANVAVRARRASSSICCHAAGLSGASSRNRWSITRRLRPRRPAKAADAQRPGRYRRSVDSSRRRLAGFGKRQRRIGEQEAAQGSVELGIVAAQPLDRHRRVLFLSVPGVVSTRASSSSPVAAMRWSYQPIASISSISDLRGLLKAEARVL